MISERPKLWDKKITDEAAQSIAQQVLDWVNDGPVKHEPQEVLKILQDVFSDAVELDAYCIARELELEYYWSPNEKLVDILSEVSIICHKIHARVEKEWVCSNNIQPKCQVGDRVNLDNFGWNSRKVSGTIVAIMTEIAKYVVQEDDKEYPSSKIPLGLLVPYEKVETKESDKT